MPFAGINAYDINVSRIESHRFVIFNAVMYVHNYICLKIGCIVTMKQSYFVTNELSSNIRGKLPFQSIKKPRKLNVFKAFRRAEKEGFEPSRRF